MGTADETTTAHHPGEAAAADDRGPGDGADAVRPGDPGAADGDAEHGTGRAAPAGRPAPETGQDAPATGSAHPAVPGPALLRGLTEMYLDLHRHPELSGAEARTAAVLAARLAAAGLAVTEGVGGHGVVGMLSNGPGPVVLLRAELDGLPVRERTGLRWASTAVAVGEDGRREPVMHACGHDVHLAAAAGAAALLAAAAPRWRGTLLVVGQPAEETLSGAAAMLADGLYRRWPLPDAALAQHVGPAPAGLVLHARGPVTAAAAFVEVVFAGAGGHGASPGLAADPPAAAAELTLAVRRAFPPPAPGHDVPYAEAPQAGAALPAAGPPGQQAPTAPVPQPRRHPHVVAAVGALHSGVRPNIVPDEATVSLGLRSLSEPALEAALAEVRALAAHAAAAAGCPQPPRLRVTGRAPVQHNDEATAAAVLRAHRDVLGPGRVLTVPPSTAAEDFPLFGADGQVPTAYWSVGGTGARAWAAAAAPGAPPEERIAALPVNHSPSFAPDPVPTLRTATTAAAAAALALLDPA